MKRILLVGATGLIGASVYQNLSKSYEIIRLGRRQECEIQADLSKPETLKNLGFAVCEAVIHCAGVTDEDFKSRPADAFIQSSLGMNSLIQSAIESRVNKFIYISTSHVYGHQSGKVNEDCRANPLSDYAIAHFAAEQTLQRNAKSFENCWILRPNAVFGEPHFIDKFDRWNLIPFSFPLEAVYNQKIVLRSSGEQSRNLIATDDIADCIKKILLMNQNERFTIINPLGKETLSVYQLALKTADVYQKLTGNACEVERPADSIATTEDDFIYQTKFEFQTGKAGLETYLRKFISRILGDYQNGKRYIA